MRRIVLGMALLLIAGVSVAEEASPPAPASRPDSRSWTDVVCRVNGHEILRRDVEAEKKKLLPWASFHGKVDAEKQNELRRQALQTLIRQELAYRDARRRELEVDAHELEREFQKVVGKYGDEEALDERLRSIGASQQDVRDAIARNLLMARVEQVVADAGRAASDEDVRRYYEENESALVMPRQAKVKEIRIALDPLERDPEDWQAALDRAQAMRERFLAGEGFEKLPDTVEKGPEARLEDLGNVHPGRLDEKLDAALWKLAAGEVSEPIRSFKGVHLLFVESFTPERQLPFEEIAARLKKVLAKRNSQQRVEQWREDLRKSAKIEILEPALRPVPESETPAAAEPGS